MGRRHHPSVTPKNFTDWAEGEDAVDAFATARMSAELMKGIGGFDAHILEKDTFVEFHTPAYLVEEEGLRLQRMILVTLITAKRIQLADGYHALDLYRLVDEIEDEDSDLSNHLHTDAQWTAMLDLSDMVREYGAEYTHEMIRVYCQVDGPCIAVAMGDRKWLFAGVV